MLSMPLVSSAVPASPRLIPFIQEDGTTLNVRQMGDESFHYFITEDGYLLSREGENSFCYADVDAGGNIVSSKIRATSPSRRTSAARAYLNSRDTGLTGQRLTKVFETMRAERMSKSPVMKGPGLFPRSNFPSKGKQKAIVILVQFQDVKFSTDASYFTRMLNEEGFSDYGGTGSARQYYIENSMGQFEPDFDLYGPVTVSQNMSYYGADNNGRGNDIRPGHMVREACQILHNQGVDFSQYDRNNDGYVDNVYVFYAGHGQNESGVTNQIWPHAWDLSSSGAGTLTYDGVTIYKYGCSNEMIYLNSATEKPDGIGTFTHEFGHILGLPDLYATSYSGAFTPGKWCVMDAGSYNNNSCTPPAMGAFERYALDWATPVELTENGAYSLNSILNNECFIINTSVTNNYFMFENRQQTGWDKYIPGHGMLAWRIKYDSSVWNTNKVNDTPGYCYVDIIEADNILTDATRAGDAFPGTSGITQLSKSTTPALKTMDGYTTEIALSAIKETDGVITFNVTGGNEKIEPVTKTFNSDITPVGFTAGWEKVERAAGYRFTLYEADGKSIVPGYDNIDLGDVASFAVTGLDAETLYLWTVTAYTGSTVTQPSAMQEVTTLKLTLEYTVPQIIRNESNFHWFEFEWEPVEGATHYIVNVYTKEPIGYRQSIATFEDVNYIADKGWESDSEMVYTSDEWAGSGKRSLRLTAHGQYLMSPVFREDVSAVSFWHKGKGLPSGSHFNISAKVANKWQIVGSVPVSADKGITSEFSDMPAGTSQIRITLDAQTGARAMLSAALDDVNVKWGVKDEAVPVSGHENAVHPADRPLVYRVTEMEPGKDYYYTVMASDGTKTSPVSAEGNSHTWLITGITEVDNDMTAITVDGLSITVNPASQLPVGLTVTTPTGAVVMMKSISGKTSVQLPSRGIYLVSVGTRTYKVKI